MDKRPLYIIGVIIVLVVLGVMGIRSSLDYDEVSSLDWSSVQDWSSEEPFGYHILSRLLEESHGKVINKKSGYIDTIAENALHVLVGEYMPMTQLLVDDVKVINRKGGKMFISASNTYCSIDDCVEYTGGGYIEELHVKYEQEEKNQVDFSYAHHDKDVKAKSAFECSFLDSDERVHEIIASEKESGKIVCARVMLQGVTMELHTVPQLLTNLAAREEGYLDQYNFLFADRKYDRVFLYKAEEVKAYVTSGKQKSASSNPLKYIMQSKSLRWAYLLLLLGLLLYLINGRKRIVKAIPVREPKNNTSLEFVKTVSRLFLAQNQNSKLCTKLKKIFYHKAAQKYFLDRNSPTFAADLSDKSQVPIEDIKQLIHQLEQGISTPSLSDNSLINLHKSLDSFYLRSK